MQTPRQSLRHGVGGIVTLCALALFVAGCSSTSGATNTNGDGGTGAPGSGSCAQMVSSSGFSIRLCTDYAGLTADQEGALRGVCATRPDAGTSAGDSGVGFTGAFSASSCDRTDALGGCRVAFGGFM